MRQLAVPLSLLGVGPFEQVGPIEQMSNAAGGVDVATGAFTSTLVGEEEKSWSWLAKS